MKRNTPFENLPQIMKLSDLANYLDVPYDFLREESKTESLHTIPMQSGERYVYRTDFINWLTERSGRAARQRMADLEDLLQMSTEVRAQERKQAAEDIRNLRGQVEELGAILKSSVPAVPRIVCAGCGLPLEKEPSVRPRTDLLNIVLCNDCHRKQFASQHTPDHAKSGTIHPMEVGSRRTTLETK